MNNFFFQKWCRLRDFVKYDRAREATDDKRAPCIFGYLRLQTHIWSM